MQNRKGASHSVLGLTPEPKVLTNRIRCFGKPVFGEVCLLLRNRRRQTEASLTLCHLFRWK